MAYAVQLNEDRATGNTLCRFAALTQNRSFHSKTANRNEVRARQVSLTMMPQSKSAESLLNSPSAAAAADRPEVIYQNQMQSESLYEIVPAPFVRNFTGPGDVVRGVGVHAEAAARFRGSDPATATAAARKRWRKPLQHIAQNQNGVRSSWTASRVGRRTTLSLDAAQN